MKCKPCLAAVGVGASERFWLPPHLNNVTDGRRSIIGCGTSNSCGIDNDIDAPRSIGPQRGSEKMHLVCWLGWDVGQKILFSFFFIQNSDFSFATQNKYVQKIEKQQSNKIETQTRYRLLENSIKILITERLYLAYPWTAFDLLVFFVSFFFILKTKTKKHSFLWFLSQFTVSKVAIGTNEMRMLLMIAYYL